MTTRGRNSSRAGDTGSGHHKPGLDTRLVATMLVTRVVDDGRNLDALCDAEHGLDAFLKLPDNDRSLARAIAITALRHRNRIEAVIRVVTSRPLPGNARFLIHSLHAASAQILFLDIPDTAAVDIAVTAIGRDKRTGRFSGLANAVLRRISREKTQLLEKTGGVSPLPAWLNKRLRSDFGKENAARVASALGTPPHLDITVKTDPGSWAQRLGGIVLPTGSVRLLTNRPVRELEGFSQGEWWVQESAAALPARLIKARPGSEVLELCAAPGGKTAQLCNAGYSVTAVDSSEPRMARLEQNLSRLGFSATTVTADILEWEPEHRFDCVLLDAPCSSTGTARRHPDVLWARRPEEVPELADLQYRLVLKAAGFVKPGGCLVFSNCSLLKEEGEDLLARIAREHRTLIPDPIAEGELPGMAGLVNGQGAVRTMAYHMPNDEKPELSGMDGFFACRFRVAANPA